MLTARRLGLPKRTSGAQRVQVAETLVADVLAGWDDGLSITAMASMFGIGKWIVTRVLSERGRATNRNNYGRQRLGPAAHNWHGGRQTNGPYIFVYLYPDDPFLVMTGHRPYVAEHRLVMARHLGRPLLRSETVHHIDGDGHNNTIENLQLRQGNHGKGVVMTCLDCGSHNIQSSRLAVAS